MIPALRSQEALILKAVVVLMAVAVTAKAVPLMEMVAVLDLAKEGIQIPELPIVQEALRMEPRAAERRRAIKVLVRVDF
jgi:hypothetical protein